jgi:hypothetical protein
MLCNKSKTVLGVLLVLGLVLVMKASADTIYVPGDHATIPAATTPSSRAITASTAGGSCST